MQEIPVIFRIRNQSQNNNNDLINKFRMIPLKDRYLLQVFLQHLII